MKNSLRRGDGFRSEELRSGAPNLRSAVKDGWIRFVGATRQKGGFGLRQHRRRKGKSRLAGLSWLKLNRDPVDLTVMALNYLGPAVARANTTGKRVVVLVPDDRLGQVFRAALALSQSTRATDRLIDIVVDPPSETDFPAAGARPH
jgi:hypothetical protein